MTSRRRELEPGAPLRKRALSLSVLVHLVAAIALDDEGALPERQARAAPVWMEIAPTPTVAKPEPPAPPPPAPERRAEPEPPVAVPQKVAARSEAPPKAAEPAAEQPPTPEAANAPLDLRSVMLGGEAAGFSVAGVFSGTGSKGTSHAAPRTVSSPAAPPRPSGAAAAAPPLVPARQLAARPVPPALEDELRANYPEGARRRGIGGRATVRARIDPDGVARAVVALSETLAGFGEACRRTITGSRWSPPRDHSGRAVATEVRYTCNFVIQ
ncbi:MAG TPA: TonB family protein [Polyangiaceae bacterium]|nr:MAG: hypothetical protein DIU78_20390 [Pseudomonadota bacterium]HLV67846.1 TonB family protein [Polyangiaceae bacterium]